MSSSAVPESPHSPEHMPFVAPCRTLGIFAPLRWLRLGLADMQRAPRQSLIYGIAMMALAIAIALASWRFGVIALYIGITLALVFLGPAMAVGLYSISHQLGRDLDPLLGQCVRESKHHFKELLILGIILLVVLLVWARAAAMVHVFFPTEGQPTLASMLPFLAVGSVVGSIFATVIFAASAFSLPMLMERKVDAITATVTSINAVLHNKKAMLVWASLIALSVGLSLATAFLGFAVLLPLIGHASWHGYQETIDATAWPHHRLE